MRDASSVIAPSPRSSIATPICDSSVRIVRTSLSRGTWVSASGSSVRSEAHRIGSAAFFAPETATVPASGRPPSMTSLSIPGCYCCWPPPRCAHSSGVSVVSDSAWTSSRMRSPSAA